MSIRIKQLVRISDDIVKELLQGGHFPSTVTFLSKLVERTNGRILGAPTMKVREADYRKVTRPDDLNLTFREAKLDLAALFDETVEQVNRLVLDYDYQHTWRERLKGRVKDVYEQMHVAREAPPYVYVKTFGSFKGLKTDVTGRAYVNLKEGVVTLPESGSKTSKVDLFNASVNVEVGSKVLTSRILTSVDGLKDDNLNSAWHHLVEATKNGPAEVLVAIKLPQEETISRVTIRGHSPGMTRVNVMVGDRPFGEGVKPIGMRDTVSWDFVRVRTKEIKIILSKDTSDDIFEGRYRYHFGLQNVGLFYNEYEAGASLETNAITFLDDNNVQLPVGSFTVQAVQESPQGTGVDWYYSFDTSSVKAWVPLSLGKIVHHTPASTRTVSTITGAASGSPLEVHDRIAYYSLGTVPEGARNVKVKRGGGCWRVDSFHYPYDENPEIVEMNPDPVPTIADFIDPSVRVGTVVSSTIVKTRYMSRLETNSLLLQPISERPRVLSNSFQWQRDTWLAGYLGFDTGAPQALETPEIIYPKERVLHKLTAHLYVKENLTSRYLELLKDITLSLPSSMFGLGTGVKSTIYLNGTTIAINRPAINVAVLDEPTITITLEPGWNTLEIIMNNYRMPASGTNSFDVGSAVFSDLIGGTNVTGVFGAATPQAVLEWWGERYPLTQVSRFELFYQTNRNDDTRYTVKDGVILLNYMPYYSHVVEYETVDLTALSVSLFLAAMLYREESRANLTPKIHEFKVEMLYE